MSNSNKTIIGILVVTALLTLLSIILVYHSVGNNRKESLASRYPEVHAVVAMTFSPDGKSLAICDNYSGLTIWEKRQGLRHIFSSTGDNPHAVAFDPNGKELATVGTSGIVIWDTASWRQIRTFQHGKLFSMSDSAAYSQTNDLLICSFANEVYFIDTQKYEMLNKLEVSWISSLTIHPDGSRFAIGFVDGSIQIRSVNSKQEMLTIKGSRNPSLDWSPSGDIIACGGDNHSVLLLNSKTGAQLGQLSGPNASVLSVKFNPTGEMIASAGRDKSICIWEVSTGRFLKRLQGHEGEIHSLCYSPDGKTLASGSDDQTVRFWDPVVGHTKLTLSLK